MDEETQPIVGGLSLSLLWDMFTKHRHEGLGDQKLKYDDLTSIPTSFAGGFKIGNGVRSTGTGTGTQTVTCGFQPQMILMFSALDDDSYTANSSFCVGAYTATDSNKNLRFYYDGGNTKWRGQYNSEYIVNLAAGWATISAVSSTGFSINWGSVGEDMVYLYIAFK